VIVYIAEAHAADAWPINSSACHGPGNSVLTPRSLAERCETAARMAAALGLGGCARGPSIVVDSMDDGFLETFAAWPTRLFGISADGCTIERIAQPHDASFELAPMLEWLQQVAGPPQ